MNVLAALTDAKKKLARSPTSRMDAELLLAKALNCSRVELVKSSDRELTASEIDKFAFYIEKRSLGYPIAYLLGYKEFWSLELKVTENVLIPRPETELLVETVLNVLPKDRVARIIDLGTGSGAVALSIAKERPNWSIVATDISEKALDVARENAKLHDTANVSFVLSDWFKNVHQEPFDAIVSNPPYIAENEMKNLENDVLFEPKLALLARDNGLYNLNFIISQAGSFLNKNGILCLEHGATQGELVRRYFKQGGYTSVRTLCDLAGLERVTYGTNLDLLL